MSDILTRGRNGILRGIEACLAEISADINTLADLSRDIHAIHGGAVPRVDVHISTLRHTLKFLSQQLEEERTFGHPASPPSAISLNLPRTTTIQDGTDPSSSDSKRTPSPTTKPTSANPSNKPTPTSTWQARLARSGNSPTPMPQPDARRGVHPSRQQMISSGTKSEVNQVPTPTKSLPPHKTSKAAEQTPLRLDLPKKPATAKLAVSQPKTGAPGVHPSRLAMIAKGDAQEGVATTAGLQKVQKASGGGGSEGNQSTVVSGAQKDIPPHLAQSSSTGKPQPPFGYTMEKTVGNSAIYRHHARGIAYHTAWPVQPEYLPLIMALMEMEQGLENKANAPKRTDVHAASNVGNKLRDVAPDLSMAGHFKPIGPYIQKAASFGFVQYGYRANANPKAPNQSELWVKVTTGLNRGIVRDPPAEAPPP